MSDEPRIVIYLSFDPETDVVDLCYGDEDPEIVIELLRQTLEAMKGFASQV